MTTFGGLEPRPPVESLEYGYQPFSVVHFSRGNLEMTSLAPWIPVALRAASAPQLFSDSGEKKRFPFFGKNQFLVGQPPKQTTKNTKNKKTPQTKTMFRGAPNKNTTFFRGAPNKNTTFFVGHPNKTPHFCGAPKQNTTFFVGHPTKTPHFCGAPKQNTTFFSWGTQQKHHIFCGAPKQNTTFFRGAPNKNTTFFVGHPNKTPHFLVGHPQKNKKGHREVVPLNRRGSLQPMASSCSVGAGPMASTVREWGAT